MSEAQIKRNPHPDFKKVEASRPPFDTNSTFRYTQTVNPSWTFGSGANSLAPKGSPGHVSIDPDDPARPSVFNYKMLISAITPRPIAFISSYWPTGVITENGTKNVEQNGNRDVGRLTNLAPFSYFNMVAHDPPTFVVGFASPLVEGKMKDTLANLNKTGECVLNIISEHFIEAANSTSINAPPEASEWDVSGLTQVFDCVTVPKCARVKEAIFSVECKVESIKEIVSRREPGKKTGAMVILEGTRFWVREDAVNEDLNIVDPKVLRPISRLGGITYARTTEVFEIPRPDFVKDYKGNL